MTKKYRGLFSSKHLPVQNQHYEKGIFKFFLIHFSQFYIFTSHKNMKKPFLSFLFSVGTEM